MTRPLLVRATINLPGFPRGTERFVNPEDPYIVAALEAMHLVVVRTERQAA